MVSRTCRRRLRRSAGRRPPACVGPPSPLRLPWPLPPLPPPLPQPLPTAGPAVSHPSCARKLAVSSFLSTTPLAPPPKIWITAGWVGRASSAGTTAWRMSALSLVSVRWDASRPEGACIAIHSNSRRNHIGCSTSKGECEGEEGGQEQAPFVCNATLFRLASPSQSLTAHLRAGTTFACQRHEADRRGAMSVGRTGDGLLGWPLVPGSGSGAFSLPEPA